MEPSSDRALFEDTVRLVSDLTNDITKYLSLLDELEMCGVPEEYKINLLKARMHFAVGATHLELLMASFGGCR